MNPVFCTVTSTFLDPSLNDKVPLHDAAINFLSPYRKETLEAPEKLGHFLNMVIPYKHSMT